MIFKIADFILDRMFRNQPTLKQFFQFSLVGGLNAIVDFSIYFSLTRSIDWFKENYLVANALAFLAAVTCSFFLNNHWTFKERAVKPSAGIYFKYLGLGLLTLAVIEFLLYQLVNNLGVYDLYAKILILLVSAIINFSLSRLWIFKKTD
ncbi:MAG: GtrA family protein [Candidatus Komeilibacteria bacterium]|nr:GtrA family protein [Candidatus Komeilibacteria bacterium]